MKSFLFCCTLYILILVTANDLQEKLADSVNNMVKYFFKNSDVSLVVVLPCELFISITRPTFLLFCSCANSYA